MEDADRWRDRIGGRKTEGESPAGARDQMPPLETRVLPDPAAVAEEGARVFRDAAREAILRSGAFRVALSGGSTPRALYTRLAAPPFRGEIDWKSVLFLWGDERCVPPGDPRSNYRMAREALLDPLGIAPGAVVRIEGERPPEEAAAEYERALRERFAGEDPPRFDLVFLGMGADGHTASLFPKSPALSERRRFAVASRAPDPPEPRVTLTYPVVNAARRIVFLVTGAGKSGVVRCLLERRRGWQDLPASGVAPCDGKLLWLLDREAASQLESPSLGLGDRA